MSNDNNSNWGMPDFSKMFETLSQLRDIIYPAMGSYKQIQKALTPIIEFADTCSQKIKEAGRVIAEAARPILAVEKMGEAQFVCWEYLSNDFINDIISTSNVNKTLTEYIKKDGYHTVNKTIDKCSSHYLMKKHHRLYTQSVDSFRNGHNDLAVTGFTSVFDGLLSDISHNSTTNLKNRIDVIKKKIEKDETLDHDEYATLSLAITLEKALDSFSAFSDFSKKEPKELNRHWIAHGRSTRKRTKLDCVKMINLIAGLLLINDLESMSNNNG